MGAVFGGLQEDTYDREYGDRYLLKRIASYFAQHKRKVILLAVGFIVVSVNAALPPIFVSEGVDMLEEGSNLDLFWLLIGALIVFALIQYFVNWLRRYLFSVIIGHVVAQMRKDAFGSAVERDLAFYDKHKSGKIVSRITSDTQEFGDVLLLTGDVLSQMIYVLILLVVLVQRSVQLTLITLALMPLIVATVLIFRRLARIATRQGARAMAVVNDTIQESVTGISVAKNFRKEAMIYDEFTQVNEQSFQINMRRGMVLSSVFPMLTLLSGLAVALVVYAGAQFVVWERINVGSWFLFIQGGRAFLVSSYESGRDLESVPAGVKRDRTHLRSD